MNKLPAAFYRQTDVVAIARSLLGKLLVTCFNGELTSGRIVETEAYNGVVDKASHAYGGRRTRRTEIMFADGGFAYVYLCYGIHHLFNIVTNVAGIPHAVLIRGIQPVAGLGMMMQRMNREKPDHSIGRGPGNVSRALGILTKHTGTSLLGEEIFVAEDKEAVDAASIVTSTRIGVAYAAEDALLPYRFSIRNNPYVSGKRVTA